VALLIVALVFAYLFMAPVFLTTWLKVFKVDPSFSSEDRLLCIVIYTMATILWPVVVPISYLELLEEKINDLDVSAINDSNSLRPFLISGFLGNLLTIFGLAVNVNHPAPPERDRGNEA
jgi:hypothetical protein